ncbi:MAG: AbrB/MazE/SpoVT family DNA-binding domain-containing protein [Gemmatimonadaceae bacterium]
MSKQQTFGLVALGDKGRIVLPDAVRRQLDLHPGDYLLVERTERGAIELVPADVVPRDQRWFAHPEMQQRIAEAEASIEAGDTTKVRSVEEAQAYLDSLKGRGEAPATGDVGVHGSSKAGRVKRSKGARPRKNTAS